MRPNVIVCSGSEAWSRGAATQIHRQPAQHAHMVRLATGCSAPVLLHGAWHGTAISRQPALVLSYPLRRTCSLSSTSQLPHSQFPGSCCSSGRRLVVRRSPWRPGRQSSRNADTVLAPLAAVGSSSGGGQSMDDAEEGDAAVTRELEGYEVERFRQMGRHLDLMWNVGKKPQPAPCDCCEGSGSRNCRYCNSTGAMMVGHERFCSLEQGCKPCPICNGTGEVKCSHCQGTGYRAGWLERGCPVEQ